MRRLPDTADFHDARIPHRSRHAIAQARCGPARVRMARHIPAATHAELSRLHQHRLILAHRGDRSPRSPEATRTPSGSSTRGRFVFWRSQGKPFQQKRDGIAHPKHPGMLARGRESRAGAGCAVPGCFGTGGGGMHRNGLAVLTSRQCATSLERSTAVRARMPVRCARHCRGVCRGSQEGVARADDSSAWESSGACRWPPVRIRFVHHWIAQSGRASVL